MAWLTKAGLTPHNFQADTRSRSNCNTFICSNPFPNIVWHSVATTFMIYWQPKLHPTLLPRSYVASLPVLASLMYLYNATAQLPGCHDFLLDILSILHTKAKKNKPLPLTIGPFHVRLIAKYDVVPAGEAISHRNPKCQSGAITFMTGRNNNS